MTEDFGGEASMAPGCQIAMETPIPPQLSNCLLYIFLLKTLFFFSFFFNNTLCCCSGFLGILALFGKLKIGEGREQELC